MPDDLREKARIAWREVLEAHTKRLGKLPADLEEVVLERHFRAVQRAECEANMRAVCRWCAAGHPVVLKPYPFGWDHTHPEHGMGFTCEAGTIRSAVRTPMLTP